MAGNPHADLTPCPLISFLIESRQSDNAVYTYYPHNVFSHFDALVANHKGTKVKTIGDAYMAVFGAPEELAEHPRSAVEAALDMVQFVCQQGGTHALAIRIGIHTGSVIAGVVGRDRMQFDIFGDTVNIASRFESSGQPNRINVSQATYRQTQDFFEFEKRGHIRLKSKESMEAYFVVGRRGDQNTESAS